MPPRRQLKFLRKDQQRDERGRFVGSGAAQDALRYFHDVETRQRPVNPAQVSPEVRQKLVTHGLLQPLGNGRPGHSLTEEGRVAASQAAATHALRYFHDVESGQRRVGPSVVPAGTRERLVQAGLIVPRRGGGHMLAPPAGTASGGRTTATTQGPRSPMMAATGGMLHEVRDGHESEVLHALASLRPEAQAVLKRYPLNMIGMSATLRRGELGIFFAQTRLLGVASGPVDALFDSQPASQHVGMANWNPRPGDPKPTGSSFCAANKEEKRATVLTHELGHAVQLADPATSAITHAAYARAKGGNSFITQYAKKNPAEYFAESFALYNHSPEKLLAADPNGHKMVKDVFAHYASRGIAP